MNKNKNSESFRKKGNEVLQKACKGYEFVVSKSKHVSINKDALEEFAKQLTKHKAKEKVNWLDTSVVDFSVLYVYEAFELLILFHSLNFCYWGSPKWTITTKDGKKLDGSQAMLYVCYNILVDCKFNPKEVVRLSNEEFASYLEGNIKIPLLFNRYIQVKSLYGEICRRLSESNLTSTYELFENIDKDDETLLGYIINYFNYAFMDIAKYLNKKVYFYKRAQLLVSDILSLLNSRDLTNNKPIHLLGCADYKIPQILEAYGILEYDDKLKEILRKEEQIPVGLRSLEVEIRANTLKVIELLSNETSLTRMEVNDMIWLMSQGKQNISKLPYHRVTTTSY